MDKVYNFQAKETHFIQLKHLQNFYSDDEVEKSKSGRKAQPSNFSRQSIGTTSAFQQDESPTKLFGPKSQNKLQKKEPLSAELEKGEIQFSEDDQQEQPTIVRETSITKKHRIHPRISITHGSNSTGKLMKVKQEGRHPFRHLVHGRRVDLSIFQHFLMLTKRGLIYGQQCLRTPSDQFIHSMGIQLPLGQHKKCLFLDLDETLIHSCIRDGEVSITIYDADQDKQQQQQQEQQSQANEIQITFNIRPYCVEFLSEMSKYYNVYVFTASQQCYANSIIKYLDPKGQYITHILTRECCMETRNGFYIKNLKIFQNVHLKDMVIVDNLSHSFGFQVSNGIPILEWHDDPRDEELLYLSKYLIRASRCDDVRIFNETELRLNQLVDYQLE